MTLEKQEMIIEINKLRKEMKAVILAHNYQIPEIQDIADFVGDSFKLSHEAAATDAEVIVFCGVQFMAESAKILSPNKKVLFPVMDAGCPMADMIDVEQLKLFKKEYPDAAVVCYVNSSAKVKAESDICCTSSNAVKVIKSLNNKRILFVPDQNLGNYISNQVPDKEIICWKGFCPIHQNVKENEIDALRKSYPNIKILIHPECNPSVLEKADFTGSTSQIIKYVKKSEEKEFIIGTEIGILYTLEKENPEKKFYSLSSSLVCHDMKKTTLQDVYDALKQEKNEITVDEGIQIKAYQSLKRMLEIS